MPGARSLPIRSFDIYCQVVDNLGDAGVAWRLARQLASQFSAQVRFWIDQPQTLARIAPGAAPGVRLHEVQIFHWDAGTSPVDCAQVVISAFGCNLPATVRKSIGAEHPPIWINLEYLSAEDWIDGCHGLASRKPGDAAIEYFYYPGFTERSGGLIREQSLFDQRDAFLQGQLALPWLREQGIDARPAETRISLFCYPQAPALELFVQLEQATQPIHLLIPEAVADEHVQAFLGEQLQTGQSRLRGNLRIERIPMLEQSQYDRVLWSCSLNFVRGEDSWIRAVWSGIPFVWQPYRQAADLHRVKLDAFLNRLKTLASSADQADQTALFATAADLMRAWSDASTMVDALPSMLRRLPALAPIYRRIAARQAEQSDLAHRLLGFCAAIEHTRRNS